MKNEFSKDMTLREMVNELTKQGCKEVTRITFQENLVVVEWA